MQIKDYVFTGLMAATLFACAPSKYEADGAFSSEPAFSQAVRPTPAVSTKPVPPNTTKPEPAPNTTKPEPAPITTKPEPAPVTTKPEPTATTPATTPITTSPTPTSETDQEVTVGEPAPANAGGGPGVNVLPENYTATAGNSTYIDDTGKQLIDNQIGGNIFNSKIFGAPGYEWLGWSRQNVTMAFKFAKERKFTLVKIGFNYNVGAGISLPKAVIINGKSVALKGTELKRNSRGFLIFNVGFTTNQIVIELERNPSRQWILVDEVKFVAVQQPNT
jgi:hypothetical protein